MKYKTSKKEVADAHPSVAPERILETAKHGMFSLDSPGICLACGEDAEGIEPDARYRKCECCDEPAVFGAEELMLRLG